MFSRVAAMTTVAGLVIGGCRAFVDLEGLGGGPTEPREDSGFDANPEDVAVIDAGGDTKQPIDATPNDVVTPDVDASKPCPSTGGASVRIPTPDGGSFCIDSTEVTRKEYAAFLATNPNPANQIDVCKTWNTTFAPAGTTPPPQNEELLPAGVNWCDAYAFCKWAGKRLCGKVGGGALSPAGASTLQSEYMFTCSAGGTRLYPYGDTYDPQKCNGGETNAGLEAVKSRPGCEGGFKGVYDTAGNTHQWLDVCVLTADPKTDGCYATSSAYDGHPAADMPCTQVFSTSRDSFGAPHGFRCCAD